MNNRNFARVAITARLREQSNANVQDDAAHRRDWDHVEGLIENAQFDADREARREQDHHDDIARLQSLADQHLTDKRDLPRPESATVLDAMIDAGEAEEPSIDYEAIAWAYQKLLAYGVGNTGMDNAMMLDRLNLMLLTAEVA